MQRRPNAVGLSPRAVNAHCSAQDACRSTAARSAYTVIHAWHARRPIPPFSRSGCLSRWKSGSAVRRDGAGRRGARSLVRSSKRDSARPGRTSRRRPGGSHFWSASFAPSAMCSGSSRRSRTRLAGNDPRRHCRDGRAWRVHQQAEARRRRSSEPVQSHSPQRDGASDHARVRRCATFSRHAAAGKLHWTNSPW